MTTEFTKEYRPNLKGFEDERFVFVCCFVYLNQFYFLKNGQGEIIIIIMIL